MKNVHFLQTKVTDFLADIFEKKSIKIYKGKLRENTIDTVVNKVSIYYVVGSEQPTEMDDQGFEEYLTTVFKIKNMHIKNRIRYEDSDNLMLKHMGMPHNAVVAVIERTYTSKGCIIAFEQIYINLQEEYCEF